MQLIGSISHRVGIADRYKQSGLLTRLGVVLVGKWQVMDDAGCGDDVRPAVGLADEFLARMVLSQ